MKTEGIHREKLLPKGKIGHEGSHQNSPTEAIAGLSKSVHRNPEGRVRHEQGADDQRKDDFPAFETESAHDMGVIGVVNVMKGLNDVLERVPKREERIAPTSAGSFEGIPPALENEFLGQKRPSPWRLR